MVRAITATLNAVNNVKELSCLSLFGGAGSGGDVMIVFSVCG